MLVALMSGRLDGVDPSDTQPLLRSYLSRLQDQHPQVLASISDAAPLSQLVRAQLDECLSTILT